MSFKSVLKRLARIVPVIAAHAPTVIAAVKEVKAAAKKKPPADERADRTASRV